MLRVERRVGGGDGGLLLRPVTDDGNGGCAEVRACVLQLLTLLKRRPCPNLLQ